MINKTFFGETKSGEEVNLYTLINAKGTKLKIINYGCIIQGIELKKTEANKAESSNSDGNFIDVVLGYDTLENYEESTLYMGAIVGRFANRIGKGKFVLDGKEYELVQNDKGNHLHGGIFGFDRKVWTEENFCKAKVTFSAKSSDGEEGYPGNLNIKVTYELSDDDEIIIDIWAMSDKATPINITNHVYFNLNGNGIGNIHNQEVEIFADKFTENDENGLPTGKLLPVGASSMKFPINIGEGLSLDCEQIKAVNGYDHNFVLTNISSTKYQNDLKFAARAFSPTTNISLELLTTQPGMQFYSGNFITSKPIGKGKNHYDVHSGFCFEAQGFPDAINKENFPNCVIKPEEEYVQKIIYKFSCT